MACPAWPPTRPTGAGARTTPLDSASSDRGASALTRPECIHTPALWTGGRDRAGRLPVALAARGRRSGRRNSHNAVGQEQNPRRIPAEFPDAGPRAADEIWGTTPILRDLAQFPEVTCGTYSRRSWRYMASRISWVS